MTVSDEQLRSTLSEAVESGKLLDSASRNIVDLIRGATSPLYAQAVSGLIAAGEWPELNDRFYKALAFGTGGLRGRTIGKIVAPSERGNAAHSAAATGRPQFPCVGTNAMNYYSVSRATQGLVAYLHDWFATEKIPGKPKIVIAYDTRHFSKEFAELTARVASDNGCDACVFEGPRSTPELSFAVRHLRASAGIVITASHNPPHDNGYKVYFSDGAQVIEPQASGIIAKVNTITTESYKPMDADLRGATKILGREIDEAYMERLETLILDRAVLSAAKDLRVVFTPIHGTGGVITKPMFQRLGFSFDVVEEQDRFDGNFPTVKSPNPENAEALAMGVDLATRSGADVVVATDPDCDRMGVAVRTGNAADAAAPTPMKLLTGNQIGSLIAWYRAKTLFEKGVLNRENAGRGVIIKTFVTTDLQKAIAEHYGLRCVETLTGFKYIGAKLGKYERLIPKELRAKYVDLPEEETRRLRLEHSSFYVFGGEESYGYSGADFVRDKDGNGSAMMFCEVAAYAKSKRMTVDELLDEIFATFGYFEEKNASLTFEGAKGAAKILRLVDSYTADPPAEMLGTNVSAIRNFERETFRDVEGDVIPKERMSIFELADRTRIAVRPSGTEPKIKFYLFAERRPQNAKFSGTELAQIKGEIKTRLDALWEWLQQDAAARLR